MNTNIQRLPDLLDTSYYDDLPLSKDLICTALLVAYTAHQAIEQKRKFTNENYINHPIRVAQTMIDHEQPSPVVAAALLHDVLEDTGMTANDLLVLDIPSFVVRDVEMLTEDKSIPRDVRKAAIAERAKTWRLSVCLVKLGDIIDNYGGIPLDEITDWTTKYFAEGQRLVDSITSNENVKNIPADLINKARQAVDRINTVIPNRD